MKKYAFAIDESEQGCAEKLKALADPTRYSVVRSLSKHSMKAGELEAILQIEQSLLSHHLGVLRRAKIVTAQRIGKSVRYSLADGIRESKDIVGIDLSCCKILFE